MTGSFYIKTFGCQMNVADSERIAAILKEQGMSAASTPEEASLIMVNGCTVRAKAVHKAVSVLGVYNLIKKQRPELVLGIGGCVGQLERKQLFRRAPYLDFVIGTDAIDSLPEVLFRVKNGERRVVCADFDEAPGFSTRTKMAEIRPQAFVNIMKGCDKHCSYCIVPYTRGHEKSRRLSEVVDDVADLVARGVREVTFLGQNVNSFGKTAGEKFPSLLRAVDADPRCARLKRIRFTSSHPYDFSEELMACYASPENGGVARLAPHLHLPVQSGSNRVLKLMRRDHSIEDYVAKMRRLRELCPEIGLSTDLIVGFPSETEEDFADTVSVLGQVEFDSIYAFAYSPRPGTPAAGMPDDVTDDEKNRRLNRLLDHQTRISEKRYAARIGKVMEVLVEGESKNHLMLAAMAAPAVPAENVAVWTGRTVCNRVVNFVLGEAGASVRGDLTGRFARVKITRSSSLSLHGELVEVCP